MLTDLYHYYLINKSGLFDRSYYLINNPDVRKVDVDPLLHFIKFGWKEGRDPSNFFSTGYYLQKYVDVRESGLNPLVHYIKHGIKVGRLPFPIYESKYHKKHGTENSTLFVSPLALQFEIANNESNIVSIGKSVGNQLRNSNNPEQEKEITIQDLKKFIEETATYDTYIISLSHDNYLDEIGGIQITISDHQKLLNNIGIGYMHIYPSVHLYSHNYLEIPFTVNINMNGNKLGLIDSNEFIKALKLVNIQYNQVVIHQTMGFRMDFILRLLREIEFKNRIFWLHDFYSICPNFFLLRNDNEYCHAPNIESNACTICLYGNLRQKHQREYNYLFSDNEIDLIAPSEFAVSLWQNKSGLSVKNYSVTPHVKIEWKEKMISKKKNYPLRIAFVGTPMFHKGWDVFKTLTDVFRGNRNYLFFLFSNQEISGNFECIHVSVHVDRFAMVNALIQYQIDVAILWSLCPESFSYTLHESLSAGCFILTNPFSGNIQDYIRKNPELGLVISNKQSLIDLFSSGQITEFVSIYQQEGKPQADIFFST